MSQADELRRIARELLSEAASDQKGLDALVGGLKVVTLRLQAVLVPLFGWLAVRMIMEKAVRRSALRHPFLNGLLVFEDGVEAGSLPRDLSDRDYVLVQDAFEDLVTSMLDVLVTLVGIDITLRLANEVPNGGRVPGTGDQGPGAGGTPS